MADITTPLLSRHRAPAGQSSGRSPAASPDPHLITFVELLFFAYRDFTREADAVLAEFGLGRAHHRVLHFVHRHPALRVADLLEILKITKQSLARVLKELVAAGFVEQRTGARDRRQRLLHTTATGRDLAVKLAELQSRHIGTALASAGIEVRAAAERFLFAMIDAEDRGAVGRLIGGEPPPPGRSPS
jgi:DNA-binding MarR family transcriptional regulator